MEIIVHRFILLTNTTTTGGIMGRRGLSKKTEFQIDTYKAKKELERTERTRLAAIAGEAVADEIENARRATREAREHAEKLRNEVEKAEYAIRKNERRAKETLDLHTEMVRLEELKLEEKKKIEEYAKKVVEYDLTRSRGAEKEVVKEASEAATKAGEELQEVRNRKWNLEADIREKTIEELRNKGIEVSKFEELHNKIAKLEEVYKLQKQEKEYKKTDLDNDLELKLNKRDQQSKSFEAEMKKFDFDLENKIAEKSPEQQHLESLKMDLEKAEKTVATREEVEKKTVKEAIGHLPKEKQEQVKEELGKTEQSQEFEKLAGYKSLTSEDQEKVAEFYAKKEDWEKSKEERREQEYHSKSSWKIDQVLDELFYKLRQEIEIGIESLVYAEKEDALHHKLGLGNYHEASKNVVEGPEGPGGPGGPGEGGGGKIEPQNKEAQKELKALEQKEEKEAERKIKEPSISR
jgi:hypothetical protein